jgi:tetratricopeptide (TPR) repeat protein
MRHRVSALALATAALTLSACNPGRRAGETPGPSASERAAEAQRLAVQAQRAEDAGNEDRAIDLYRASLDQSTDLFFTWHNLGVLLMRRGEYQEAVGMFTGAAEVAPSDPRPYEKMGLVYLELGYAQKAYENFETALQRDPRYLPALRGAIGAAKTLGVSDEKTLERVRAALLLETDPDWRKFLENEQARIDGHVRGRATRGGSRG